MGCGFETGSQQRERLSGLQRWRVVGEGEGGGTLARLPVGTGQQKIEPELCDTQLESQRTATACLAPALSDLLAPRFLYPEQKNFSIQP